MPKVKASRGLRTVCVEGWDCIMLTSAQDELGGFPFSIVCLKPHMMSCDRIRSAVLLLAIVLLVASCFTCLVLLSILRHLQTSLHDSELFLDGPLWQLEYSSYLRVPRGRHGG